jgi:hypothetical protein
VPIKFYVLLISNYPFPIVTVENINSRAGIIALMI